eukprot:Anaeramoba_ignava/a91855_40.p1 GENE.a91855_40~~a91855_40.p1  ORF type:complete len:384 (-),score=31.55 a91855_40:1070-2221(-)
MNKKFIYADNAATTIISNEAYKAMTDCLYNDYGNPSSSHFLGRRAKDAILKARESIAREINCSPSEILFTSSGSESITQAIHSGANWGKQNNRMHIISSQIEHKAVLDTLKLLEKQGFKIDYIKPNNKGVILLDDIKRLISEKTAFISLMYVNNEIGTIQPIDEIGCISRKYGALFHSDCVQAITHLNIDVEKDNIDFASFSAHKFHGPKGVGFLYHRKGIDLVKIINGGNQERGFRGGTENVASILSMVKALEVENSNLEKNQKYIKKLKDKLEIELKKINNSYINGDLNNRVSNIINVRFDGIEGEDLLLLLEKKGILVSAGAACTSGSIEPSHVLLALGLNRKQANSSIRISLSSYNNEEQIDEISKAIKESVQYLRENN